MAAFSVVRASVLVTVVLLAGIGTVMVESDRKAKALRKLEFHELENVPRERLLTGKDGIARIYDETAVARGDNDDKCCKALKSIPNIEFGDSVDVGEIIDACLSFPNLNECLYGSCCIAPTNAGCELICHVKAFFGFPLDACVDECKECYTCKFERNGGGGGGDGPFEKDDKICGRGECSDGRVCKASADREYCTCLA